MGHFSKAELNLTYFYTKPKCLLVLWKDLSKMFQEQHGVLKKSTFGEVMRERNICPLRTQYIFTFQNGQMCVHMMSPKVIHTRHHIHRFLRRYLVLKIHLNTGQMPDTTAEGKKKNMAKSEGRALLTVETLNTFYCCIYSPLCRMNPNHFVTKLEK